MSLLEPQPELAFCNPADFGDVTSPAEYAQRVKMAGAQAIDRILKAVGREHVPHNLDRQSLCREIADAYFSRDCAFDLSEGSKSHQRLEELRRMREAAETLIALLKPDVGMDAMIAAQLKRAGIAMPTYPSSQPLTFGSFLEQLGRAIRETETAISEILACASDGLPRKSGWRVLRYRSVSNGTSVYPRDDLAARQGSLLGRWCGSSAPPCRNLG